MHISLQNIFFFLWEVVQNENLRQLGYSSFLCLLFREFWMNNSVTVHWGRKRKEREKVQEVFPSMHKVWKQWVFRARPTAYPSKNMYIHNIQIDNKLVVDKWTISHLIWKFNFLSAREDLNKKSFKKTEREKTRLTPQYS